MGTGGPFPGGKARTRRDADHSSPYSAEVKNELELYLTHQAPPWRVVELLYFYLKIINIILEKNAIVDMSDRNGAYTQKLRTTIPNVQSFRDVSKNYKLYNLQLKVKVNKCVPLPPYSAKGERKYSSYSFLTSTLEGGEWSASRPGRSLPRYPLDRRLRGPQSRSGHRG
jgi:hypothetical protein